MEIDAQDTALVLTDPQTDFLSPDGVTWALVGASVEENGTVEHIEQLLKLRRPRTAATRCFISPHYYYQARFLAGLKPGTADADISGSPGIDVGRARGLKSLKR